MVNAAGRGRQRTMADYLTTVANARVIVTCLSHDHCSLRAGIGDHLSVGLVEGILCRVGSVQVAALGDVHHINAVIGGVQDGAENG